MHKRRWSALRPVNRSRRKRSRTVVESGAAGTAFVVLSELRLEPLHRARAEEITPRHAPPTLMRRRPIGLGKAANVP